MFTCVWSDNNILWTFCGHHKKHIPVSGLWLIQYLRKHMFFLHVNTYIAILWPYFGNQPLSHIWHLKYLCLKLRLSTVKISISYSVLNFSLYYELPEIFERYFDSCMYTAMATRQSTVVYLLYAWQSGWFSKIWSHIVLTYEALKCVCNVITYLHATI